MTNDHLGVISDGWNAVGEGTMSTFNGTGYILLQS